MSRAVKSVFFLLSLLILMWSIVFVINQTYQVVQLAETAFGKEASRIVLWSLLTIYAVLILVPLVLFFRLPRTLVPPRDEASPAFKKHLSRLRTRLKTNRRIEGFSLETKEDIEKALKALDTQADGIIKETASFVFVSTAVSQRGALDALIVLSAQSKMVWQVAHVHYQRPTFREMTQLYANVAITAFMASKLDDIASEQVGSITKNVLDMSLGAIPVVGQATAVVTNSVFSGSINALLTLRVGIITRRYCNALTAREKGLVRKLAVVEAAKLLGAIVAKGMKKGASKIFWWGKQETEKESAKPHAENLGKL